MSKKQNTRLLFVLKWELIQLLFCIIFLALFYFQEMAAARYLGRSNQLVRSIHSFLNALQFSLLPDYFFVLFFPLMLISIALIVFKTWRWFFLGLCGAFLSVLLVADKIYFSFFSSVITIQSFSAAGLVWDVRSAVMESITWVDIFFIAAFGVFIFFGVVFNKKIDLGLPKGKTAFAIDKLLGILICLLAIYTYNVAFYIQKRYVVFGDDLVMQVSEQKIDYTGLVQYTPTYESSNKSYASSFGLLNFHVKNATDTIKDHLLKESNANKPPPKGIYSFFDQKKKINKMTSPFYGIASGRNVFVIHFESLNPILIGTKIGGTPVTPTLNRLEKSALYWPYILDQSTIGGSSDAEFASLTGMFPGTEKISAFNTACMTRIPALPRQLKSLGYQTISLHGNEISFWNRNISQPLLGFETMYFKKTFHYEKKIGLGISDKEFYAQSIDLLKNHPSPFFAFLITLTSHYPYREIPAEYYPLFNKEVEPDSLLDRYLQAIRYSDDALGEFFAKIKNEGLWENSIFVIYGDHRPGSDEEMDNALIKATGKSSLRSPRYSCVPVLIVIPGYEDLITENKELYRHTVGGLYDIFPTIMHLIGEEVPFGVFGSHLFVQNKQRDAVLFLRIGNGFVYNGILYRQQGRELFKDNMGLVFTNEADAVIPTEAERLVHYKKALSSIYYCNHIYANRIEINSLTPDNDLENQNAREN